MSVNKMEMIKLTAEVFQVVLHNIRLTPFLLKSVLELFFVNISSKIHGSSKMIHKDTPHSRGEVSHELKAHDCNQDEVNSL